MIKNGLVLACVLGVTLTAHAGDVALTPTRIEVSVDPGDDYTTVVSVMHIPDGPEDLQEVRLSITSEDWDMDENGNITFSTGEPFEDSARPWIVFSPGEQRVRAGDVMKVRLSIIVPEDAKPGEYRAALLAQPRVPYRPAQPDQRRLNMLLRIASILYVTVPPVRPEAGFENLTLVDAEGTPEIVGHVRNSGEVHLRFHDSFEIYTAEDSTGAQAICIGEEEEAGVALGGRERFYRRALPCELTPGRYRIVYRLDAGESHPVLEGETYFTYPLLDQVVKTAKGKRATPNQNDSE